MANKTPLFCIWLGYYSFKTTIKNPENQDVLRRERDSNPRNFWFNGFQDRRIRPLCHLSGAKIGLLGRIPK